MLGDPLKRSGLRVACDNLPSINCSEKATYNIGHMSSKEYYLFGRFEWVVRSAVALNGTAAPLDWCTWLSLYQGNTTTLWHNEIAYCWDRRYPTSARLSWWIGSDNDTAHTTTYDMKVDPGQGYHNYTVNWTPG